MNAASDRDFKVAGWRSEEQEAKAERDYRLMLVDRFERGLPLSKADQKEARRLIREAKAFSKQRGKTED